MSFFSFTTMCKPLFVSFEGGEGTGKSTQVKLFVEALKAHNIAVHQTREPGGTTIAEQIRTLVVTGESDKMNAITETLLFAAARHDHVVQTIRPALAAGQWVVSDRFHDSTLVYQHYAVKPGQAKMPKADVETLVRMACGATVPDITVILDIPVEIGLSRSTKRLGTGANAESRFENKGKEFHYNIRQGFLTIAEAEPNRCVVVDASGSMEDVHRKILAAVAEKLNQHTKGAA